MLCLPRHATLSWGSFKLWCASIWLHVVHPEPSLMFSTMLDLPSYTVAICKIRQEWLCKIIGLSICHGYTTDPDLPHCTCTWKYCTCNGYGYISYCNLYGVSWNLWYHTYPQYINSINCYYYYITVFKNDRRGGYHDTVSVMIPGKYISKL